MLRVAAGEPPDLAYATSPRPFDSSARVRRGSGAQFPAFERLVVARGMAERRARGSLGRDGNGGAGALRSDAGEDHRRGATREQALASLERSLRAHRSTASRPIWLTCGDLATRCFARAGKPRDFLPDSITGRARSKCCSRARIPASRNFRAASAIGTSACRLRGRWTISRFGSPIGSSATLELPRAGAHGARADVADSTRRRSHSPAPMKAELDGERVLVWTPSSGGRRRAQNWRMGAGQRTYLAVRGGFDVPQYMGSRATFTLGQFGGHAGRALRAGDTLRLHGQRRHLPRRERHARARFRPIRHTWTIGVMYGPHGAPDFFTDEDIDTFFAASGRCITTPAAPACA